MVYYFVYYFTIIPTNNRNIYIIISAFSLPISNYIITSKPFVRENNMEQINQEQVEQRLEELIHKADDAKSDYSRFDYAMQLLDSAKVEMEGKTLYFPFKYSGRINDIRTKCIENLLDTTSQYSADPSRAAVVASDLRKAGDYASKYGIFDRHKYDLQQKVAATKKSCIDTLLAQTKECANDPAKQAELEAGIAGLEHYKPVLGYFDSHKYTLGMEISALRLTAAQQTGKAKLMQYAAKQQEFSNYGKQVIQETLEPMKSMGFIDKLKYIFGLLGFASSYKPGQQQAAPASQ